MASRFVPIRTARLVIRTMTAADGPAIHRYMSDPAVTRWLPEGLLDSSGAQAFAEKNAGRYARAVALLEGGTGNLVGHMDFHAWFGRATHEIGWAIARPYQGRGYATEAAVALVAYAFETLRRHRIVATCQPENVASWRVMEKLGMRREGHFRKCIPRGAGEWWDEYFYALLAEERPIGPRSI